MGDGQPAGEPFVHRLRVRYAECDPLGIVFNAQYLAYIDLSLTELWRAAFGGYEPMLREGVETVVADARLRFRAPARFDEELEIAVSVGHLGTTGMSTRHLISRAADGELVLDGRMRYVWVDTATLVKTPIPDWARGGLTPHLIPDPAAD